MTTAKWGNPETASFAKVNLRLAVYDDYTVQVHKYIWRIVEHLFKTFGNADIDFSSLKPVDDPLKRGFELHMSDVEYERVAELVESTMFNRKGNLFTFMGDATLAEALTKTYEADAPELQNHEPAEDEPAPAPTTASAPEPMALGDETFIRFIQYLIDAENITGVMDYKTKKALVFYQRRHGVPETGEVDTATLTTVVPQRPQWFRPGATGQYIKVIQAAFKALGYYDQAINGVWGVQLSRALRKFQADYRIHPRLRIGSPEWTALFNLNEKQTVNAVDQTQALV